jgi:orotate phosphoribosyltransferase
MKVLNNREQAGLLDRYGASLLAVLLQLGGYYKCPKDAEGRRLGPLVGYAKRYDGIHQFVGDVYLNFAVLEEYPTILKWFAQQLARKLLTSGYSIDVFCGAPMGGLALAMQLAEIFGARYCFPEKEVVKSASSVGREYTRLIWGRHQPQAGDRVAIVEDLLNNFSTTEEMINLIEREAAASVAVVTGLFNRSLYIRDRLILEEDVRYYSVLTLAGEPVTQFRQDDLEVVEDIAADNVVWKPKHEWARLEAAILEHGVAL